MEDQAYSARVAESDGTLLMEVPFIAGSDKEAADAGRDALDFFWSGCEVRVTDLYVGRWQGGYFTTVKPRLIFESAKI